MVDTGIRISYPLTKYKVRVINYEEKNTIGIGVLNGYYN
jgi:hypothetical protein